MNNRLKTMHQKLEEKEPFTQRELKGLDKRDRAFIRDIQIAYRIPKDKALKLYGEKQLKKDSKGAIKRLGNTVRKRIKKYGNSKTSGAEKLSNKNVTKFAPPSKKELKKKGMKKEKPTKVKNKEVKEYLSNPKAQKDKTYSRILKASKKYPNASKYELQHGYNSTASKRYRERHNINPSNG